MPRRRKPKSLESLSWVGVATNVVRGCPQPEEVESYRRKIPPVMANRYTEELLKAASATPVDPAGSLRSAFHPDCSVVQLSSPKLFKLSCYAWCQLFTNLDTMPGLIMLKICQVVPTRECRQVVVDMLVRHLPVLQELMTLSMDAMVGVGVMCKTARLEQETDLPPQVQVYANCANLQMLDMGVSALRHEDIICLLDNLPQLKSLPIPDIEKVLALLGGRSYGLADFSDTVQDTKNLNKIGDYFPQLETLRLDVSSSSLTSISNLPRLETLHIHYATRRPLHAMMTPCISRLRHLYLRRVTKIDSVFRRDLDTTYPLTALSLHYCTDIDMVGIAKSLPKLKELRIICSSVTRLTGTALMPYPFQRMTHFEMLGSCEGWTKSHDRYLLSSCTKLQNLVFIGNSTMKDADFCESIASNPMKELRAFSLLSKDLTKAVVAPFVSSFGDSLEEVNLAGGNLGETLTDTDFAQLVAQCCTYDMNFNLCNRQICVAQS